ncbi:glycosyltransferase family 2 protein [Thiocapsa sp.]|uniref:glycosyltransferase family 2 protein n=1 Tax=Thiocapsa sp. TaxID=2024551 RepID=UPI003592EFD4
MMLPGKHHRELVSVVIPTFNRAPLIGRAISSVLAQSYPDIEVLVIDDGSTDDTPKVIQAFVDPRIRYLRRKTNLGASASRNEGIAAASGAFVAYLDSDDTWEPHKVERQLSAIRCHTDPSKVVSYSQIAIRRNNHDHILPLREKRADESIADYVLSDGCAIFPSTVLLSTSLAQSTPFNQKYRIKEDWDHFIELENAGAEWLFIQSPLTIYQGDRSIARLSGTSTPEENLTWLKDHQAHLSPATTQTFLLGPVLQAIISTGENKARGVRIVLSAMSAKAISRKRAFSYLIDIALRRFAKRLLRRR